MRQFFIFGFCLFIFTDLSANNIRITNVGLVNQSRTNHTWQVRFDLAWDNSWAIETNESNFDVAWVFIKYRPSHSNEWRHVMLDATIAPQQPVGSVVALRRNQDGKCLGALIRRATNGISNVSFQNIGITWNYGSEVSDDTKVEIEVFAIEMVRVNEVAFSVGDGASVGRLCKASDNSLPFEINSEAQIVLGGTSPNNLSSVNAQDDFNEITTKILPAAYPKGSDVFYCMKYLCSMGQYVDFLNNLTSVQATAHFPNENTYGHTIIKTGNVYSTTTPERACNFLSFFNTAAYAEWSGLRPLSELEFEKACRGILVPVAEETASGIPFLAPGRDFPGTANLINTGTENEMINAPGNLPVLLLLDNYFNRPLRCGILAASQATSATRANTNSSYWGITELTDNLLASYVGISSDDQRAFNVSTGNGYLNTNGSSLTWAYILNATIRSYQVSERVGFSTNRSIQQKEKYTGMRCGLSY